MSDLDNQGSLPSYVERDAGRSPRAKDVPAEPEDEERTEADEEARGHRREDEPAAATPFEPSADDADGDALQKP
ncbi:hypothetical protein JNB62_01475 [Microbacterium jejuense]|uniref:Uncharacterized protein n=1 Tax=Microbacterium jejuense TaxID=1263637 RepID=A0ABS7HHG0_9MICO|nr:hypothetical protein [Microbacterium jejuense]MBW9092347.1 hypothetical protein [Microbacterium jejuense]